MKTFFLFLTALTFFAKASFAQVSLTATAGATGPAPYSTLKGAFDAINAGTHQGAITINITDDTTETATAALNASGSGAAAYTSVLVRPTGGPRTITGTILGAIIKLNGADNVTIDGRINGTGRNLTVSNSNPSTATAAIWLASVAAGNGASNNVIRNLELACAADQQASANATFGIIQTGAAISVAATDGNDNDNNAFIANRIIRVRYGIVSRGVTGNNNIAPVITDNIIGPATFGPDQIGRVGIYMTGDTNAFISRNTIQNIGALVANGVTGADRIGIAIGSENWATADSVAFDGGDYTVTRNVIHDIVEEKTFSAAGIRLGTQRAFTPTNNLVANNFIFNIRANGTAGDQVAGIGYAGGNMDRIVFNSISLTGDLDPAGAASASNFGNGIRVSQPNSADNINLTLKENSIYLDVSSNTATVHYYAITLNNTNYAFGAGGMDVNNYFTTINPQLRTGGLATAGGAAATSEFNTLANWKTALTTPQDPNSIQGNPLYVSSTTNLHIQSASPNINVTGGGSVGVTDDIDGDTRPGGPQPDIGADEFFPISISINNLTLPEGNAGTANFDFTVSLSAPSADTVTVNFSTLDGSATTADSDYIPTSGTVTFPPGTTTQPITVLVNGDGNLETNEQFSVVLSNPVNATIASNIGQGTISNDDSPPTVSMGDASAVEGSPVIFTVSLSGSSFQTVTVRVNTTSGTATGDVDYNQINSFFDVVIAPSATTGTVSVPTFQDAQIEGNETFNINVISVTNGTVLDGQGQGTIIDDDAPPSPTPTPTPTPTATPPPPTPTATPTPSPTPSQLGNISTRLRVLAGDNALIGGMIAIGAANKRVIIRAIGPTLFDFGLPDALPDPTLELFQGSTSIATNDDWVNSPQSAEITNSGLAPGRNAESAIIVTLIPNQNYTAVVRGKNGQTGIGVVEAFDLDPGAPSKLGNISTRGFVDIGNNVMIAGLIVGPSNAASLNILVRALGPTLGDFGVQGFLANPTVDLVNANGVVIRSNDSWQSDQGPAIQAAGLAPAHVEEAALIETVTPGAYTAIVRGSGGTTGVGLVEVYNLP